MDPLAYFDRQVQKQQQLVLAKMRKSETVDQTYIYIYIYIYCKWIDINIIRSTSIIKCALLWLLMDPQVFLVSMLNSGEKSSLDLR